jgi:hydrogenase nickel incorporation protein HypA/HybF
MHELSIANSVLDAVRAEIARRPGPRLLKVGLRVGELAGVDPEALSFGFQALVKGTEFEPATLEIESCPRRHRCRECGLEFTVRDYNTACPDCGASRTECISGDELELAYLELEEHEPQQVNVQPSA